ncbi:MAG: PLD nuclease N-terminal domain-containing protein [Jatrophihabitantaceae bacterium]
MLIRLGGVFFLLSVIFWLWAIFDTITADNARIRGLPKFAWVILVLLFLELGALAWVLFGRPRAGSAGSGPRWGSGGSGGAGGSGGSRLGGAFGSMPGRAAGNQRGTGSSSGSGQRRPVGPDDDPDFLRGLSKP